MEARIKELTCEVNSLKDKISRSNNDNELTQLKKDIERNCFLITSLYEAGTGTKGQGPKVGLVEDVVNCREELLKTIESLKSQLEENKTPPTSSSTTPAPTPTPAPVTPKENS